MPIYSPELLLHCGDNEGFPTWVFFNQLVSFAGKLWSIGGSPNGHTGNNLTEIFSTTDGVTWTLEGQFPVALDSGIVLVHDSKIWAIGGTISGVGNSQKVYSTSNGVDWSEVGTNSLPYNIRYHAGTVHDGKMWISGGVSDSNTYKRKVHWSTDGLTWTEAGSDSLPYQVCYHAMCSYDGKLWISGGDVYGVEANSRKVYWSTDGTAWTEAGTDALPVRRVFHKMLEHAGKMWVLTGLGSASVNFGDPPQEVYWTTNGSTWTTVACDDDWISKRESCGVAVYDSKIFVVGDALGVVSTTVDGATNTNIGTRVTDSSGNDRHGVTHWIGTSIVATAEGFQGACFAGPEEGELRAQMEDDGICDIAFPGLKFTGGRFFSSMRVRSTGLEDNDPEFAYDPYIIFCQGLSTARAIELKYDNHVNNRLEFRITDGSLNTALAYADIPLDGEWHRVDTGWDKIGGLAYIWVDKILGTSSGTATGDLLVTDEEFIYGEDDWTEFYEEEDPYFYAEAASWEEDLDEWRIHTDIPGTAFADVVALPFDETPDIDIEVEDIMLADKRGSGFLKGYTSTIGQMLAEAGGIRGTRLTAPTTVGATTLAVESTDGWATSGVVGVEGVVYGYTGKTISTLTGITHQLNNTPVAGAKAIHALNTGVWDLSRQYSALDQLWRAMLLEYATDSDLDVVCRNLGVNRTVGVDDTMLRALAKVLAYSPKGTIQTLEAALTVLVGAGNFAVTEDLINHPNTVYIELPAATLIGDRSEGRTYLEGSQSGSGPTPVEVVSFTPDVFLRLDENTSSYGIGNSGSAGSGFELKQKTGYLNSENVHLEGKLAGAIGGLRAWDRDGAEGDWGQCVDPYPMTAAGAGSILFMGWLWRLDSGDYGVVFVHPAYDYIGWWRLARLFSVQVNSFFGLQLGINGVNGNDHLFELESGTPFGPLVEVGTKAHFAVYYNHDAVTSQEFYACWKNGAYVGTVDEPEDRGHVIDFGYDPAVAWNNNLLLGDACADHSGSISQRNTFQGGMDNLRLFFDQVFTFADADALVVADYADGDGNSATDLVLSVEIAVPAGTTIIEGVHWKEESVFTDCRTALPSTEYAIEYPDQTPPGTQNWVFQGDDEAEVIQETGEGGWIEFQSLGPAYYRHIARIQPESEAILTETMRIDSDGTLDGTDGRQACAVLRDGGRSLAWGVIDDSGTTYGIGFINADTGAFLDTHLHLELDAWHEVTIRKRGGDLVQLEVDGVVVQELAHASFAATTDTRAEFGNLTTLGSMPIHGVRNVGLSVRTATDYWPARGTDGEVAAASAGVFVADGAAFEDPADVGKQVVVSGSTVTNGQGGNNNGRYFVSDVNSATSLDLVGESGTDATLDHAHPTRVVLPKSILTYPDDLGKQIVISGSTEGNNGPYVIVALLQEGTLVDFADFDTVLSEKTCICEVETADFASELNLDWQLNPLWADESGLSWELSDAGSISGENLILRDPLPIEQGGASLVLEIGKPSVLTAQLLENEGVSNDPVGEYYPFYLFSAWHFLMYYLDELTAAGVIAEIKLV